MCIRDRITNAGPALDTGPIQFLLFPAKRLGELLDRVVEVRHQRKVLLTSPRMTGRPSPSPSGWMPRNRTSTVLLERPEPNNSSSHPGAIGGQPARLRSLQQHRVGAVAGHPAGGRWAGTPHHPGRGEQDLALMPNFNNTIEELPQSFRREQQELDRACLLYTSPSPRDLSTSRMPSSA